MGKRVAALVAAVAVALTFGGARAADAGLVGDVSNASTNWSGFAIPAQDGQHITAISGSWIVPFVRPMPPGRSSSWIGIGGYDSADLIQVGTSSNGSLDDTYAFFELIPDYESRILAGCAGDPACHVSVGDHMAASITNNGGDTWTIMLANLGDGVHARWYWARVVSYHSTLSSAEWIFEAPFTGLVVGTPFGSLPVLVQTLPANAPRARFLGGTYRLNGGTQQLRPAVATRIFTPAATPSPLDVRGRFSVCAYKLSCKNN